MQNSRRTNAFIRRRKFLFWTVFLCLVVLFQYIYIFKRFPDYGIYYHRENLGEPKLDVSEVKTNIAIILQRSPVKTDDQQHRVLNIDRSWALWLRDVENQTSNVFVYSVFPFGTSRNETLNLKYIEILEGSSTLPVSAFHNLVRT